MSGQLWAVVLGAGLGGGLRHAVGHWIVRRLGDGFPWHTLAINVSGAFLLALLMGLGAGREWISPGLRLFLGVGLLGGYTTFSTLAWEGLTMVERGQWLHATLYLGCSAMLGLFAAVAGLALGKWLT